MTSSDRTVYIAYIDGMRALSVLAVMAYHMDPTIVPGGFVGVDVFFVISGFVVTASLASHGTETLGKFLGTFYARRLARLMPGLVVMLLVTTLAYVLLVPAAWFNRAAETVGQAAFWGLSNWVLHGQGVNYFEPRAELNPFTHTWSLGVEEQFYLIAPLLLFMALRKSQSHRHRYLVSVTIGVMAGASLLFCYYFGVTQGARFVFYHLVFRFWELAAGVLLFLLLPHVRALSSRFGTGGRVSGRMGLFLIIIALLAPDASAYPFVRTTVAVLGSMLLISSAHSTPQDGVRRALASRIPVWVGQRSYALYLWHWPVYVIARWTVGLTVWPFNFMAVALSFLLAATSYRAIEQPFRRSQKLKSWPLNRRIGFFLLIMAMGWLVGRVLLEHQQNIGLGKVTRESPDWYAEQHLLKTTLAVKRVCEPSVKTVGTASGNTTGEQFYSHDCSLTPVPQLFVIGDSHATAYLPMLEQLSAQEGRTVTVFQTPGCHFLDLMDALKEENDSRCYRTAHDAVETVLVQSRPGDIVFLPSLRLPRLIRDGGDRRAMPKGAGDQVPSIFDQTEEELAGVERAVLDAPNWLDPLVAAGLKVVLEAPKPIFQAHPYFCMEWWNRTNPDCSRDLEERRVDMERYRAPVMDAMKYLSSLYPAVKIWDPLPILCGDETCRAMREGRPLFFDADHLSPYGNLLLLEPFKAELNKAKLH